MARLGVLRPPRRRWCTGGGTGSGYGRWIIRPDIYSGWDKHGGGDACEGINELAAEHQPLPPAVVAGRDALHMRCILLDSTWELWIDSETGVLLRVVGPLGNSRGDFPRWADDYLFDEDEGAYLALPVEAATIEVVDISYDPAFGSDVFELTTPAGWSDPGAAERSEFGSIPPFYAKVSTSLSLPELEVTMVYEIWYRGEAGWRLTSLERQGSGEFIPPGGFEVWTGNQLGEYNPDTSYQIYADGTLYTYSTVNNEFWEERFAAFEGRGALVEWVCDGVSVCENAYDTNEGNMLICEVSEGGRVATRTVTRYDCGPTTWFPEQTFWIDNELGYILKSSGWFEVLTVDLAPSLAPGLFDQKCATLDCSPAPTE